MKNFKNLFSILLLCFFASTTFAQDVNFEGSNGLDRITLMPEVGGIVSNYLFNLGATPNAGNNTYATFGLAYSNVLNYGVSGYAPIDTLGSNALNILGDASITGSLWIGSDRKLKTDIQEMGSVLMKIKQLKPSWYQYQHKEINEILPIGQQTGFIAQELQAIFPHLVTTKHAAKLKENKEIDESSVAYNAVNYIGLIPVLVKGLQEQQEIIENFKQQANEQEKRINKLEELILSGSSVKESIQLENPASIRLEQNRPNPFKESTSIDYFVPEKIENPKLVIFDSNGSLIQSHKLVTGLDSSIEITIDGLPSGQYIYSIFSENGISSKQMVFIK